ncbi:transcriptional enhancer factor TEF-1 isoform X2 [Panulirus ornatus]|uniref:transcriptional enhancer factor TEF-1 isoform X2 n=1 Tax=Panulirus ornatus TaxID=150431 RepID=UPI003A86165A
MTWCGGIKISSAWPQGGSAPTTPVPAVHLAPLPLTTTHKDMDPLEDDDVNSLHDDKDVGGADAEGVWSPDIEQSFQEALAIYPPCGRRKIILSDEGKMYGRNELIARYIKLRTGKTRTRKQVSSHIQVLARRKLREIQAKLKGCTSDENGGMLRLLQGWTEIYRLNVSSPPPSPPGTSHIDSATKEKALHTMSSMSSAQIVSATAMHSKASLGLPPPPAPYASAFWQGGLQAGTSQDVKPFAQSPFGMGGETKPAVTSMGSLLQSTPAPSVTVPPWEGRSIATQKLRLVEFSAFMEAQRDPDTYQKHLFVHIGGPTTYADPILEPVDIRQIYDKFPEKKGGLKELYDKGPQNAFFLVKFWADLNVNIQDESGTFYGVTSQYESPENMTITCSTKVCSFGKQVVEKVETEYARFENGRFVYRIHRSPMCEYMINFIHKLKHLPEKYMMNSVLENFTILQVVTNRDTQETLLCVAYVFEVSTSEHGAQHHIYRLVKD